jgi:hypothetical protein
VTGECVLLGAHGRTDTDATYQLMNRMAVLHAQVGADIIGPAAVLDSSVRTIRAELDEAGFREVGRIVSRRPHRQGLAMAVASVICRWISSANRHCPALCRCRT